MTAPTKEEFFQAAINSMTEYPGIALQIRAGNPLALCNVSAQATMLAMMAQHVEVSRFEAFSKTRDSTVLADAALKGILPLGRPYRITATVQNDGAAPYVVSSGRVFMDGKGRLYQADASVTVPAGQSAAVGLTQKTLRTVTHTVSLPRPFYEIEVPLSDATHYLADISVLKSGVELTYSPEWVNVQPGDAAYTLETDELRRLWVRLGDSERVGLSASAGDTYELRIVECEGQVSDLSVGDTMTLQYIYTPADGLVRVSLASVVDTGSNPPSMAQLRVMARYPSIYDHNAVYLGEFDALLRRYLEPRFLSVWNEQIEESVRGASLGSINALFVSGIVDGMVDADFRERATALIRRADDSYRIQFVATDDEPVSVSIEAKVSVVHDEETVKSQIKQAVLAEFGDGAPSVSQGMRNPIRVQAINDILKGKVPALQDGASDFKITVSLPATVLPEQYLHVTDASLTVDVKRASFGNSLWNY